MNFQTILEHHRSMYLIKLHHNYVVRDRLKRRDIEFSHKRGEAAPPILRSE
jgi:histidinol phosphatase-like enzyme